MGQVPAQFPERVWDGSSPSRQGPNALSVDGGPDEFDWYQITAELRATQAAILANQSGLGPDLTISNLVSPLHYNNTTNEIEFDAPPIVRTAFGLNIFNNVKDFGAVGDGVADDTSSIQAAINAANGITVVYFPPGTYKVTSTLQCPSNIVLTSNHDSILEDTTLLAAGSALGGTLLSLTWPGTSNAANYVKIQGLVLNGGGGATVLLAMNNNVVTIIRGCVFTNYIASGVGIRGGGCLYTTIDGNMFNNSNGYAIDMQNSYSTTPGNSYYGINVGWITRNLFYSTLFVRISGTINIENNDFEGQVDSNAAIELDGTAANHVNIKDNYFELTQGITSIPRAIIFNVEEGVVSGNQIIGHFSAVSGTIAIDASTALSVILTGNNIRSWYYGIYMPNSATGTVQISGNYHNAVTTFVSNYSNVASIDGAEANYGIMSAMIVDQGGPQIFTSAIRGQAVVYDNNLPSLNLWRGNVYKVAHSNPTTINTFTNASTGVLFAVHSGTANNTLANSAFNLACGANLTLPSGFALGFCVDCNGYVREIGGGSQWLLPRSANTVLAGPSSGPAAVATYRTLTPADLGTGSPSSANFLCGNGTWSTVPAVTGPAGPTGPAGTLAVGTPITGSTAFYCLFTDATGALGVSSSFQYNPTFNGVGFGGAPIPNYTVTVIGTSILESANSTTPAQWTFRIPTVTSMSFGLRPSLYFVVNSASLLAGTDVWAVGSSGDQFFTGSMNYKRTAISANYSISHYEDYLIAVTSTSTTITITLPDATSTTGTFVVKDESGGAATNNITLAMQGSQKFDGSTTHPVISANYGFLCFYSNGSNWFSI